MPNPQNSAKLRPMLTAADRKRIREAVDDQARILNKRSSRVEAQLAREAKQIKCVAIVKKTGKLCGRSTTNGVYCGYHQQALRREV